MTGAPDRPLDAHALAVARAVASELAEQGAQAVALVGSHARGQATEHSDIDLAVAGEGPAYRLSRRDGYLLAVSCRTLEEWRAAFDDPGQVGAAVPAWRSAVLLHDPDDVAAGLQREAREWQWERLGSRADEWVAEQVTGYAEEVHKLVGALAAGDGWGAAVERSVLALRLPRVLAVHHRILYETEHELWHLVAERMGDRWTGFQSAALAVRGESLPESASAALRLFTIVAAEVRPLLDERQREVVRHAATIARGALLVEDNLEDDDEP